MTLLEAINARHSVRSYTDQEIEKDKAEQLDTLIKQLNEDSGLNIQLILNEPTAFGSNKAHYGMFKGVKNYIAIAGRKNDDEKCGYFGEKLVLQAQQLGLNTCWVALTYDKSKVPCNIEQDEKLLIVIALGYGTTQGVPHKSKPMGKLCQVSGDMPKWFEDGMKAAMLAPTAINQQKFLIALDGNRVSAKPRLGFYAKMDLGIVKCHFEIGAGKENFVWDR